MAKKVNRISNVDDVKKQLSNVKIELKNGVFTFTGKMSISDFASKIGISSNVIIKRFFVQGKLYNLNHVLEEEEIAEICLEYGFEFNKEVNVDASNFLDEVTFKDEAKDLVLRAPIITVMGHVDHGKTTLIDKIRKTNVAATETSGITQHTGAYQIKYKDRYITFIDTPGHEAFTKMRARGAKVTDIVVLVVAADDGVMPQTKEAIEHSLAANVPIVVFVNKMDKLNIDLDRIKGELAANNVVIEEYGGDTQIAYGSALNEEGFEDLFDKINLLTDFLDLKANPKRYPIGTVIDSRVDKGIGSVSTLIIENGTLYKGDFIVAGSRYGRIRTLSDHAGVPISKARPGTPVVISGLNYTPLAGDRFVGFSDEKFAKKLADEKGVMDKQNLLYSKKENPSDKGKKIINVIIKSDVNGTAEAVKGQIHNLDNEEAVIKVISSGAGNISNTDLLLAQASDAVIFTFNIKHSPNTKQSAHNMGIRLISHNVIYKIVEDCEAILKSLKAPVYEERKIGQAHIMKIFFYSKVGNIAGCMVDEGVVRIGCKVKQYRSGKLIFEGIIDSLRRELNDTKEVIKGKDFGTHIKNHNDLKEDDVLEFFEDFLIN